MARFLVGIDLGTTNMPCLISICRSLPRRAGRYQVVSRSAAGQRGRVQGSTAAAVVSLFAGSRSAPGVCRVAMGCGADLRGRRIRRNHGGKVPGRLVSSAKSWLCHPGVDRSAPLLPWSRAARRAAHVARRGLRALSAAPGRSLEFRHGQGSARRSQLEKQDGRADRAGVFRRCGPHSDGRGGAPRPAWKMSCSSRNRRRRFTAGWRPILRPRPRP